ncbi:DMT family transporter [Oceanicoccus sp. KOV_DT_Chl]|uniref:DMT family transporter n=1 Tax=Oceanicoccus sp. KOV_DT_Chl TaxID=1904639 RepID=UPI000C7B5C5C|nr:DMT family transporter [Oceanicoccus sp. KOV_DT_Chl]
MNHPHHKPPPPGQLLLGFGMVLIATALFSSKAIFIKLAYRQGAEPEMVMALRMLFSLPFYLFIAVYASRRFHQTIPAPTLALTFALGICGYYLASAFDIYGLQYISASLERLVLYIYPTVVAIMAVVFLGERIRLAQGVCIAVIYAGLVFVFFNDLTLHDQTSVMASPIGSIPALYFGGGLVFISAICFAIYIIGSDFVMRSLPSQLYTAYAMLAACTAIAVHFISLQTPAALLTQTLQVYVLTLIIAIFCTVLPSFMLSAGIQRVGATTAGTIGSLGPIATLALAVMLLDEVLTITQLLGFVVVMIGVTAMGKLKHAHPVASPK